MSDTEKLAEVRARLLAVGNINDDMSPHRRSAKLQAVAFAAAQLKLMPRGRIAAALGKSQCWINYAIEAGERRMANFVFRRQVEKAVAAIKDSQE